LYFVKALIHTRLGSAHSSRRANQSIAPARCSSRCNAKHLESETFRKTESKESTKIRNTIKSMSKEKRAKTKVRRKPEEYKTNERQK
jgi:hypothetical protein